MSDNGSNNHFGSGLLVGSIIGAGAIFLLGTKKGKKLLKALAEEGLDSITELGGELKDEIPAMKKKLIPKHVEKKVIKKFNQIKKSEPVREITEKLEEIRDSETVQNLSDKMEPVMDDVKEEAGNVATQVQRSAKRLFRNIPKSLRK